MSHIVIINLEAWNYPYLISVNGVVPAILAGNYNYVVWVMQQASLGSCNIPLVGNTVILKQSAQTPLCAERFAEAFREAGLPDGVFQVSLTIVCLFTNMYY